MQSKKPTLFYIEWCDAVTFSNGWVDRESVLQWAKNTDWIIKQTGYIIEENKKYLVLATKYNPQEESEDKYSEITKIPKPWLLQRRRIATSS